MIALVYVPVGTAKETLDVCPLEAEVWVSLLKRRFQVLVVGRMKHTGHSWLSVMDGWTSFVPDPLTKSLSSCAQRNGVYAQGI